MSSFSGYRFFFLFFYQLQKKITEPTKARQDIQNFEVAVQNIRDDIDSVINEISFDSDETMIAKRPWVVDDHKKEMLWRCVMPSFLK